MYYIEKYGGSYTAFDRDEIREFMVGVRIRESLGEFVLDYVPIKVEVAPDGLTFDVLDTTNELYVLIGNKLMIKHDDELIDLLIDYSKDVMETFEKDRDKVAQFMVDHLNEDEKNKILLHVIKYGLADVE